MASELTLGELRQLAQFAQRFQVDSHSTPSPPPTRRGRKKGENALTEEEKKARTADKRNVTYDGFARLAMIRRSLDAITANAIEIEAVVDKFLPSQAEALCEKLSIVVSHIRSVEKSIVKLGEAYRRQSLPVVSEEPQVVEEPVVPKAAVLPPPAAEETRPPPTRVMDTSIDESVPEPEIEEPYLEPEPPKKAVKRKAEAPIAEEPEETSQRPKTDGPPLDDYVRAWFD